MSTTQTEEKIRQLPVERVLPSPNNHRKIFNKAKYEELKASIKEHGVQTPIWVRPDISRGLDAWSIIAGERRHRVSVELKLPTIPAIVKDAKTDEDVLVLSAIENDQREDVNPMDQALAYQDVLTKGKHTPETLAEALGRTLSYVQGRLKLLTLPKKIQEAFLAGKIEFGHALLITRIKDPEGQAEFLDEILDEHDGTSSVSQARNMLRGYSLQLKYAVFSVKTVCMNCPSRSKSQADLFPEEAKLADECYDRECYKKNTREHYEARAKRLQEKGFTVLTAEDEIRKAKNDPLSLEITPDKNREWMHPKKYKTMCAECNKHIYYISVNGAEGELCMDRKCFNAMNGTREPASSSSSTSNTSRPGSSGASRQHAVFMRDRFLRSRLPAAVAASEALRLRLAVYHILCRFEQFGGLGRTDLKMDHHQVFKALMKDLCPTWKPEKYGRVNDQMLYAAVTTIPAKQLRAVLDRVVLAGVPHTAEEVLLQAAPEAGLDLEKDFLVDETYLNTLTKGELTTLMKQFGLTGHVGNDTRKKPEIIKLMLAQKLTGKVPPLVAKECKIFAFAPVKKGKTK